MEEEFVDLSFEKPKDKLNSESFTTIASRTKERRSKSGKKKQISKFQKQPKKSRKSKKQQPSIFLTASMDIEKLSANEK